MFAYTKRLLVATTLSATVALLSIAGPTFALAEDAESPTNGQEAEAAPEESSVPGVRVSEVRPNARSLTVGTGADVRLSVDLIGSQGASLTSDIAVTWSSDYGSLSDGNARLSSFRTPTTPGIYTVTAKVDASLCDEAEDCTATFRVVVQPTTSGGQSTAEVAIPVNPSGTIPASFADSAGQTYAVATPVEGGTYRGDSWWATIMPGAIADRTLLGLRMVQDGSASNAGHTQHRYTLSGSFYALTAIDSDGGASSRFRLAEPATACVPMPSALTPRLSEIALLAYPEHAAGLTVLGTQVSRAEGGEYVVCGRVSELPARLAVGVRGAPAALTVPEIAGDITQGSDSLPNTGAMTLSTAAAWLGILAGIALVMLAASATMSTRVRRRYSQRSA